MNSIMFFKYAQKKTGVSSSRYQVYKNTFHYTVGADKYCLIYLYEVPRIVKVIETENGMVVTRSWGRVKWELLFTGCKVSVL